MKKAIGILLILSPCFGGIGFMGYLEGWRGALAITAVFAAMIVGVALVVVGASMLVDE